MLRIFVDNSIKYTPAGQAIQIRVGMDEKAARIVIQDNGIGIPPDDVPHVFDRFFRSDDSRTRKSGGAGLGLSIAKWIIDRHGGSVNLISRQDIGTRITVELPVSAHAVNPI
jgi:signal transduction histidine kinase